MAGVRRLEHVALQVTDLDRAIQFYEDVMGLVKLKQADGVAYFGCGLDENFDLAVSEGGTGVDHFAIRANPSSIEAAVDRLDEHGVDFERTDEQEPGQRRGIRFDLPSGRLTMELVTPADSTYHNAANVKTLPTTAQVHPDRSPVAPVDLSHITAMTPDLRADVEFLRDVIGFHISDIGVDEDHEWHMAFTRAGEYHHDVALFDDPECSLHHLAWELKDVVHLKEYADHLVSRGHFLEVSPVRHGPGSNIAAYFQEPGGNRFEIAAEVETVNADAEMQTHRMSEVPFCVWGGNTPPASFRDGS